MTLVRMREIVASMRSQQGWVGSIDEMNEVVFLLATIAGIDAPDVGLDQALLLGMWLDAEADTWGVQDCSEVAQLREASAAMLTLLARLRRAEAALSAVSPAR